MSAVLHLIMFTQFTRAVCGKLFTFKEQVQLCADILKEGCDGMKENLINLRNLLQKSQQSVNTTFKDVQGSYTELL